MNYNLFDKLSDWANIIIRQPNLTFHFLGETIKEQQFYLVGEKNNFDFLELQKATSIIKNSDYNHIQRTLKELIKDKDNLGFLEAELLHNETVNLKFTHLKPDNITYRTLISLGQIELKSRKVRFLKWINPNFINWFKIDLTAY